MLTNVVCHHVGYIVFMLVLLTQRISRQVALKVHSILVTFTKGIFALFLHGDSYCYHFIRNGIQILQVYVL